MESVQFGEGEYDLMIEEKIRGSIPATIGYCTDEYNEKIAEIIVRQDIKNKDFYKDADSNAANFKHDNRKI